MSTRKELYHRYRPRRFSDVTGQDAAVKALCNYVAKKKVPHALMFTGGSGVGKTTLARVLARELGCGKSDCVEVNCATVEPMELVRDIQARMSLAPMGGPCRVWILDEIQSLSRATFAQQGLLKVLEEGPSHCYFMLATTNPEKVIPTVKNRCTQIPLKAISSDDMEKLISRVVAAEKAKVSEEVVEKIIEVTGGSARAALVLLEKIIDLSEEDQLRVVQNDRSADPSVFLGKLLVNPRTTWDEVRKAIKGIETADVESVRMGVLNYAESVLLNSSKPNGRALAIILAFECDFFGSRRAGLTRACAQIFVK